MAISAKAPTRFSVVNRSTCAKLLAECHCALLYSDFRIQRQRLVESNQRLGQLPKHFVVHRRVYGVRWGVGRRTEAHLQAAGIWTVRICAMCLRPGLRSRFGVVMERTGNELHGVSNLVLEEVASAKKQIIASRYLHIDASLEYP